MFIIIRSVKGIGCCLSKRIPSQPRTRHYDLIRVYVSPTMQASSTLMHCILLTTKVLKMF